MKINKKNKKLLLKEKKIFDNEPKYLKYWKIIFLVLISVVYGQVIGFDFVHLDDTKIIVDNFNKISKLSNISDAFTTQYGFDQGSPYYRPIILISFIIDSQFSGVSPVFYHISNIIFHYLTVCFLFLLLIELKIDKPIAFFLSLIFAVHPVLTNSVTWIAGRNDLLACLFSVLSFLYFIKFINSNSVKYITLHIFFFLTAILSKEVALILPILFVLYTFFFYRTVFKWSFFYKFLFIWAGSIIIFQIIKSYVVNELGNLTYGIPAIINNVQVIPEIFFKIFIPINISVLPTFTLTKTIIGASLFIIVLITPLVKRNINKNSYYFGVLWFLIFVVPGLAIYYADQTEKFDYLDSRIYLPMIGILIVAAEIFKNFKIDFYQKKELIVSGVIILIFSILTVNQNQKYKNAIVFAESAVKSNPQKSFFYQKLADFYFETKEYQKAVEYMKIAIKLDPTNLVYYKNLILGYSNLKEFDKAINLIFEALKVSPNNPELLRGLMILYYQKGEKQNALIYANKYILQGGKVDRQFYESLK
jgi:hypothetical protein